MTGCRLLLACHCRFTLPMLHASVPNASASMPPAADTLRTSTMVPTTTSGPALGFAHPPGGGTPIEKVPLKVVPAAVAPIWIMYVLPEIALNVTCDWSTQYCALQMNP